MVLRRARGALLRFVWRRSVALVAGALLIVPAVWFEFSGQFGAWWVDGLSLVLGATGAAIFWTGLTGARPDWIDDAQHSKPKT
jgi:hypothetical protein